MPASSSPEFASSKAARALWTDLLPEDRKTIRSLRDKLLARTATLSDWHRLGQLADDLTPDRKSVWGDRKVDALAELVGRGPSCIYQARKFSHLYSAQEAAKLVDNLSWGQIVPLLSIDDNAQRKALQDECDDNDWTVLQLAREIRSRLGRQRGWKHGGRVSPSPKP